jgi:hypothetical protein
MDLKTKNKRFPVEINSSPYLNDSLDFFENQNFISKSTGFSKKLTSMTF